MTVDVQNEVMQTFYLRAPNSLTIDNVVFALPELRRADIEQALERLVNDGALLRREGKVKADYSLPSYEGIPRREYVTVGSIKVPRLLANDIARPEDINIYMEAIARRFSEAEEHLEGRLNELNRAFWGNTIILFGAFIGVFALIVVFLGKIEYGSDGGFWHVLLLNTAQVIPVAVVLGLFIFLLRKIFR